MELVYVEYSMRVPRFLWPRHMQRRLPGQLPTTR